MRKPHTSNAPVFAFALAITTATATAESAQQWKGASGSAMYITGAISLTPGKIIFQNGQFLALKLAAQQPHFEDDLGHRVSAKIYRVVTPANPRLAHRRHLCGGGDYPLEPVTYLAIWTPERAANETTPLAIAVFFGEQLPASVTDPGYCASYYYDLGEPPK